jgi:hypothetical protein
MQRSEWILGFFNGKFENDVNISYRQPILGKHKINLDQFEKVITTSK